MSEMAGIEMAYIQDALFETPVHHPKESLLRRVNELELEIGRLDDLIARLYETACAEQGDNMSAAFDAAGD